MSENAYTGLTVEVRRTVEGSLYEFGVVVGGVFMSFAARSAPDVEAQISEAAQAQSEADAAATAERARQTELQRQQALEEAQRQAESQTAPPAPPPTPAQ